MNPPSHDPSGQDESPGVPGFRSWRGVYFFVFVFFVLTVAAAEAAMDKLRDKFGKGTVETGYTFGGKGNR